MIKKYQYGGPGYFLPKNNLQQKFKDKLYNLSRRIMATANNVKDINYDTLPNGEPLEGVAQTTYLLPRHLQKEKFLEYGYKESPGDYGLVKKAVGNRKLPVYQKNPDVISRNELQVVGNPNYTVWFGNSTEALTHAGNYPSAIYHDDQGNLYQKSWDLNDYGGGTGAYTWYSPKEKMMADIGDIIGSPVVVTTGFRPIYTQKGPEDKQANLLDTGEWKPLDNIINSYLNKKGLHIDSYKENGNNIKFLSLPEVIIKGKKQNIIKTANARKWKHQQGGIMNYQTWSNMSIGDQWKYRLNRAKAHLQNPNIENVWEAGKTILGGNDPENPNMNLMTAPDILPGKINPGFSIQKVRSFKFPAITNEAEAAAAKDWILSQGFKPNPKGNPIKIKTNPNPKPVSNKVIKKEEMFKTNEKHYKQDWLEDKEYGVSKSKRKAFKTAEAMESGDARRINSGYTNLKKAQLNQVEMNLHKYPQFEQKAYEKGLKNIYRRGGDKDVLNKYKREFFKKLAGQYGYYKEGGYIQQNLLPIINISDIDTSHNGWEEFSKEFLNKQKEEYLKKKLLEQQQVEQEGNLFGNFLQTGLGKVFDLIGNKKSSDTQPTQVSSTQPSSNYLSNNLNFGVKSIFGTY